MNRALTMSSFGLHVQRGANDHATFLVPLLALLLVTSNCLAQANGPVANAAAKAADAPVILLTGFEPFGAQRTANASWEGIKALDGKVWQGHRLVCRELPVVWGEPLPRFKQLIDENRPVAIFAFGMGGADAFALESRASNRRGKQRDNKGETAAEQLIAATGPDEYRASADLALLAEKLNQQGYQARQSKQAGSYLCEEALYSLEHLRATDHPHMAVMFCHVPPLGVPVPASAKSRADAPQVDAAYIQAFVESLLGVWHDHHSRRSSNR